MSIFLFLSIFLYEFVCHSLIETWQTISQEKEDESVVIKTRDEFDVKKDDILLYQISLFWL